MLPTLSLYAVVASLLWHRYKDFKGEFALFFEKNAQKDSDKLKITKITKTLWMIHNNPKCLGEALL